MSELLKPEQSKRLKQLALQARTQFAGVGGLCSYPGAAAAVKLTADQKAQVSAGLSEKEILSEDQQKWRGHCLVSRPALSSLRLVAAATFLSQPA